MQTNQINIEALEACGLEYEVAGVGSEECTQSEVNHAALWVINYRSHSE